MCFTKEKTFYKRYPFWHLNMLMQIFSVVEAVFYFFFNKFAANPKRPKAANPMRPNQGKPFCIDFDRDFRFFDRVLKFGDKLMPSTKPNLMIWEKLFVWEKLCLWLFKISTSMQDANLRSMACHCRNGMSDNSVTVASRTFKFIPNIPLLWSYQAIKV